MTKDEVLKMAYKVRRPKSTRMEKPIEISLSRSKAHKSPQVVLKIRDDVNSFRTKERWSVAYDDNRHRLYFFYDVEGVGSTKVYEGNECHYIKFTFHRLSDYIDNKGGTIKAYWVFDQESGFYYADI